MDKKKQEEKLVDAASTGDRIGLLALLRAGVQPNVRESEHHQTPLMFSAWRGDLSISHDLIEFGADVNAQDEFGSTALMRAAGAGRQEIVNLLHMHGARLDAQDSQDRTAIMYAAQNGQTGIIAYLALHGARLDYRDADGRTAKDLAAELGMINVAQLLTELQDHHGSPSART